MYGQQLRTLGRRVLPTLIAIVVTRSAHSAALWIQRINAAARLDGMSYSQLMGALHKAGIEINRKVLADLAVNNPEAFKAIVAKVK